MDTARKCGLLGLILAAGACCATGLIAQAPSPQAPSADPFFNQQPVPGGPPQGFGGRGGGAFNPGPAFAPGQNAPMPPPFGFNPMPELGKKSAAIMALRVIVGSGLTAKEIQASLPALKELRDAEKNFKKRAEQVLDEEKSALLSARPGGPLPPDSGERMHDAARNFGEKTEQAWQTIMREIGPEKAGMLRSLVQGGMAPGVPGGFQGFQGGPGFPGFQGFDPLGGGQPRYFQPQPGQPGQPNQFPNPNQQPRQPNRRGQRPQAGLPAPGGDELPPVAEYPAIPGAGAIPDAGEPVAPPLPEGNGFPQAPQPGFGANGQQPPQPGQPGGRFGQGIGPGRGGGQGRGGANNFAQPGLFPPQPQQYFGGGPQISIAELVELLEARLAAMPK